MDEQEFKNRAEQALDDLYRRLSASAEDYEFEVDFNAGALAIEFETPPGKFVVSPNSPVRQIWVSAHSKSFKLDWDPARGAFVLAGTGQSLAELIGDAVGQAARGKSRRSRTMAGVYISYPFCAQKCTYCNFASGVFPRELEPRYLDAVRAELRNTEWAVDAGNRVSGRRHAQPDRSRGAVCVCSPKFPASHGRKRRWKPRPAASRRKRPRLATRRDQSRQPGRAVLQHARAGAHRAQAHGGDRRARGRRSCAPRASTTSIST